MSPRPGLPIVVLFFFVFFFFFSLSLCSFVGGSEFIFILFFLTPNEGSFSKYPFGTVGSRTETERELELENIFYKDCVLGSVKICPIPC